MITRSQHRAVRLVIIAALVALLPACDSQTDDLNRYIAEVKARPATPIPPIPAVRTYPGPDGL